MSANRVFRHQDYELICSASVGDTGRFVPAVVVSKQVWPTRPRIIAVERGNFQTEEDAIEAAHAQGVEWIVSRG